MQQGLLLLLSLGDACIDLDGDIDTNYLLKGDVAGMGFNTHPYDGLIDCEGGGPGTAIEPIGEDPLQSYVTARDWLADMVNAGVCVAPDGLTNRATQYDWHRYWWDMTTDEGVVPQRLADVYVDMCPTNWNHNDGGPVDGRVRRRLELSTDHWNLNSHHNSQKNNGVDR